MYVYLVVNEWHYGGEYDCNIIVFSSLEMAKEELKRYVAETIANDELFENGKPKENTVVEDDLDIGAWDAYEDGNYTCNSISFRIEKKLVVD